MGYNTTVLILNDGLGDITRDEMFSAKLAAAISRRFVKEGPVTVPAGSHCNPALVIESHHADSVACVLVGGNTGHAIEGVYVGTFEKDWELSLLKQLAEKHSYVLHSKPQKKPRKVVKKDNEL